MPKGLDIRKILFLGNIFRCTNSKKRGVFISNQRGNIAWLFNIIYPIINSLYNCDVGIFKEDSGFVENLYRSYGLNPSRSGFAKLINSEPNDILLDFIKEKFGRSLIIGFELPYILCRALDLSGIPFLDLAIGPTRFMPDLSLLARSNIQDIRNVLFSYMVDDDYKKVCAGRVMSFMAKRGSPRIKVGSALFVGQVHDDTSLISNGDYLSFNSYINDIASLIDDIEYVYYKPHPYASSWNVFSDLRLLAEAKQSWNGVYLCNYNIYRLLSSEEVGMVVSLTSSVSKESIYFGKKGICLAKYPFAVVDSVAENFESYTEIYNSILRRDFWLDVLKVFGFKGVGLKSGGYDADINYHSILRVTLGSDWGMDFGLYPRSAKKVNLLEFSLNLRALFWLG